VELLKELELEELEYERRGAKIRVTSTARQSKQTATEAGESARQKETAGTVSAAETNYETHPGALKSQMVGTCYLSPSPGASKFIREGDQVSVGQPLLIIEAMKVMNLIKAPRSGTVIHIAVKDQSPVEFGQLLVVIE
jgi:acetyl-CoA carboxylase biotin carboxyl carrier protein